MFVLLLCMLPVACTHKQSDRGYMIGVSQDNSDAWHDKMRDEIVHEAVLHPELKLVMSNAYGQKDRQAGQIDSLVDAGVDLLIVCVEDPISVKDATDRAYDSGIPVVINARSNRLTKYTAYVGTDNYAVGELMAEYVLELAEKEKRNAKNPLGVLEVLGKIGAPAVSERYVGLRDSLKGKDEVKIVCSVCGDWEYDKTYMLVDSVLKVRQDVDVIVTQNDVMAMGASAAGKANNPDKDFHVLGVDALSGAGNGIEAVLDGRIAASITNVSRGDLLVQTACDILYGEPYNKDNSLQPVLVDQSSPRLVMRMTQEMNYESKVIKTLQMKVDRFLDETTDLKNTNIVLSFSLILFAIFVIFSVIAYRYRMQVKRDQEQNAQLMATQQEQLEKITAELERVRTSQSVDEEFLNKLRDEIEAHLDDSEYSVEMLAETMAVSRAQLFRRVKSLTGVTPLVMLKQIRLRKARQLLQYTDMNVQQVAYSVGYTLPSYFASNYKEMFGVLPSEERRANSNKNIGNGNKSRRK
ncbi:MAG: substrate-binding domain-containing protein [Paludibacteraceae bacterium]|nr:substrate-binding domain-containing protein [Paludibacteraceae bacterium]